MNVFDANRFELNGAGNIKSSAFEVNTSFTIISGPISSTIKIPFNKRNKLLGMLQCGFQGTTNEGKVVFCSKIHLTSQGSEEIKFGLLDELVIGSVITPRKFKSRLFGLYLGTAHFKFKSFQISIDNAPNSQELRAFTSEFGGVIEGSELYIHSLDGDVSKETLVDLANDICLMLSLIYATSISFKRYSLVSEDENEQEFWKTAIVHSKFGHGVIDVNDLDNCLPVILNSYQDLNKVEKKCIQTLVLSFSSNQGGFLEDSVLQVAQGWEIAADGLSEIKIELDDDIKDLKKKLKATIKAWKKDKEIAYDTGLITTRVIDSLSWDKVIKKIETFARDEDLDFEKLELDIPFLIEVRNSIVHTGRFEVPEDAQIISNMRTSARFALFVLIFSKLGYEGKIYDDKTGFIIEENIKHYKISKD